MKRTALTLISLVVALAACGDDAAPATTTAAPTTTTAGAVTTVAPPTTASTIPDSETTMAPTAAGDAIATATTDLGSILVDPDGMTLYLFMPDAQGESTCYDDCAANWPAFTGATTAADGADAGLVGTTERTDGTTQVTYNGWPLYYFAADAAAGDTNGQGVGGVWFVVDATGNAVEDTVESSAYGY